MSTTTQIISEIKALSNPTKISFYTHFFRADKGDICEGDKFLAIKVPELRMVVKKYYKELSFIQIKEFLGNKYNEIRFFGLAVLSSQYYKTKDINTKAEIVEFLNQNIEAIDHWNLVDDVSDIFGSFCLQTGSFEMIQSFSLDKSIWMRRISIVSCLTLLRTKNLDYFKVILQIIDNNIGQNHEYIHKAMGWILREVGKKDEKTLILYLKSNWSKLAPVTRSYATEKLRITYDIKLLFNFNG